MAHALRVRHLAGPLIERVIAALRGKHVLLVLDNFEHVLDARQFVATLLAACSGVSVLATSRAALAVHGEQEFPVPPLVMPLHGDAHAAESEAVRLFVQRARLVRPNFSLDEDSLAAVAEICRRLDGLPLALELAAARAKLLSPRAMLTRLGRRFDLLRAGTLDRPLRHRTMREVIDWSYVLLTDVERALFDRLAMFAGGISIEAAEAISPDRDGEPRGAVDVLDVLGSLCNKSLLHQEEQRDGEPAIRRCSKPCASSASNICEVPATRRRRAAHIAHTALRSASEPRASCADQRRRRGSIGWSASIPTSESHSTTRSITRVPGRTPTSPTQHGFPYRCTASGSRAARSWRESSIYDAS